MKRLAQALAVAGMVVVARQAANADWNNIGSWMWHGIKGERIYVTYEHDQYSVVLAGRYMDRRRQGAMAAGVGESLSEALASTAGLLRGIERHAAKHNPPASSS